MTMISVFGPRRSGGRTRRVVQTRRVNGARALLFTTLLASLCACTNNGAQSNIGLVDVQRISTNWPKFQNYQNQLANDAQTIERSNRSARDKAQARAQLQQRFAQAQSELSTDVSAAAKQVAADKHLTYVFTRQYVGYGGVDITSDIEKILKIEEKPSPSP
jgi:Skp family chaperone for outer membrane proteins